jgi:hypothetical protein
MIVTPSHPSALKNRSFRPPDLDLSQTAFHRLATN